MGLSPAARGAAAEPSVGRAAPTAPGGTHIPGEAGVWVLLLGDLALFAVCFVAYLVERAEDRALFAAGRDLLSIEVGAVNSLVLLSSSLAVVVGVLAHRRGAATPAVRAFAAAIALGVVFIVLKAYEYLHLAGLGIGLSENTFVSWYAVLTGVHLLHLVVGLGVLCLMIGASRRVEERPRTGLVEGGACFWHLVDQLWFVLFALLYLVA